MVKTPRFHSREHGFDPWLGNKDTAHCTLQPKIMMIIIIKFKKQVIFSLCVYIYIYIQTHTLTYSFSFTKTDLALSSDLFLHTA